MTHFGERVHHGKYGLRLNRETYAIPNLRSLERGSPDGLLSDSTLRMKSAALRNFDLNMRFFSRIPATYFESEFSAVLAIHPEFEPVTDLRELDRVSGVYILVLDEYKQAYVGQSGDIRKRIKAHWTGTKPFDRLLFGAVEESVLSIDVFRPLDTTRIFAARTDEVDELEYIMETSLPADLLLNRVRGGSLNGLREAYERSEFKRRMLIDGFI